MSRKIIYVDMDGVISDFDKAAKPYPKRPDLHVNFRTLDLVLGAKDALIRLNQDFDIFSIVLCARAQAQSNKSMKVAKLYFIKAAASE